MKQKLTNFFNLIRNNKQAKTITIITLSVLFVFTIGYTLSVFTASNKNKLANINVNGLVYNMTTNTGELDDRILRLQAGKLEQFNVTIINLNKIDTKYELIYDVCTDSTCKKTTKILPDNVSVSSSYKSEKKINGTILQGSKNSVYMILYSQNNTDNDVYIKLNLNAGYIWNELALDNQIQRTAIENKNLDIEKVYELLS